MCNSPNQLIITHESNFRSQQQYDMLCYSSAVRMGGSYNSKQVAERLVINIEAKQATDAPAEDCNMLSVTRPTTQSPVFHNRTVMHHHHHVTSAKSVYAILAFLQQAQAIPCPNNKSVIKLNSIISWHSNTHVTSMLTHQAH